MMLLIGWFYCCIHHWIKTIFAANSLSPLLKSIKLIWIASLTDIQVIKWLTSFLKLVLQMISFFFVFWDYRIPRDSAILFLCVISIQLGILMLPSISIIIIGNESHKNLKRQRNDYFFCMSVRLACSAYANVTDAVILPMASLSLICQTFWLPQLFYQFLVYSIPTPCTQKSLYSYILLVRCLIEVALQLTSCTLHTSTHLYSSNYTLSKPSWLCWWWRLLNLAPCMKRRVVLCSSSGCSHLMTIEKFSHLVLPLIQC